MVQALLDTAFYRKPSNPTSIKWTRLGSCLDWVMSGVTIHNVVPDVFQTALVPFATSMVGASKAQIPGTDACADLIQ